MDPLPSITKAFSLAIQQERPPISSIPDATAFVANSANSNSQGRGTTSQGRGRGRTKNRQPRQCSNCNRTNHTVDNCYFKHGLRPGYKPINQGSAMHLSTSSADSQPNLAPLPPTDQSLSLTREDYKYLVSLLHSSKNEASSSMNSSTPQSHSDSNPHTVSCITKSGTLWNPKTSWILDTGASDHVCHFLTSFQSYHAISPISVILPNGVTTTATHSGTIYFSSTFYLTNVFYIPAFKFNLISVHKLCSSLNSSLLFSPSCYSGSVYPDSDWAFWGSSQPLHPTTAPIIQY